MHIALNAQLISTADNYRGAGVSNYSLQLLTALGEVAQPGALSHRFTAFVNAADLTIAGVDLVATRLPLVRPPLRIAWEQLLLPWELRRVHADLVHGLVNVLPLLGSTPGIVTVHDLSFVRTPERLPAFKRAYLTQLCRASVAAAAQVIAVSQQTADDLMHAFGTPAAKITVIHNGVASDFSPGNPAASAAFRAAHDLPERYLLYLGTLEPRKNLELLVRAFGRWRQQASADDRALKLVLAGAKGWHYATIFQRVAELGLEDAVIFPGFVPRAELPDWYRGAEAFVYPSIFEGFGLPVLEAMACGAPVICSQAASLLEVAGDAALTFPANDEEALTTALHQVLTEPALRADLRGRGVARARRFSWQRTAQATLALYDHLSSKQR